MPPSLVQGRHYSYLSFDLRAVQTCRVLFFTLVQPVSLPAVNRSSFPLVMYSFLFLIFPRCFDGFDFSFWPSFEVGISPRQILFCPQASILPCLFHGFSPACFGLMPALSFPAQCFGSLEFDRGQGIVFVHTAVFSFVLAFKAFLRGLFIFYLEPFSIS